MEYTKTELEFRKLHKELLDLKQTKLARKLSNAFHNHGFEQYVKGCESTKKTYKIT